MKIEIEVKCTEKLEDIRHALVIAIIRVNNTIKTGVDLAHPERRGAEWWDNLQNEVKVAKTLNSLLDDVEKVQKTADFAHEQQ